MSTTSHAVYDPYNSATVADPYPAYQLLRDEYPVYHNEERGFWAISRFVDVMNTLHDHRTFSNSGGITLDRNVEPPLPMLTNLDPPRHQQLRTLVSRAFTPNRIAALEKQIRELAGTILRDAPRGEPIDLVTTLAAPLPITVIAELLGIPAGDRAKFRQWAEDSNSANPDDPESDNRVFGAVLELAQYLYAFLMDRRGSSGDDLVSHLTTASVDGETLSDDEIIGFCLLLLVAGSETISGLMGTSALNLYVHRDQRDLLNDSPDLIGNAVEEFLRFGGSVQGLTRTTLQETTLHDTVIPEGAMVLVLYASADRDEREFDDPATFDVRRQIKRHVGFGHGLHHCLGAALARLEAKVVFEELLSVAPNYEVDLDSVQWARSPLTRGPAHLSVAL